MPQTLPTYALEEIQDQMKSPTGLRATASASDGIRALGMNHYEAVQVVQGLTANDFHKSMPSEKNPKLMPFDVYHGEFKGVPIYIKFQQFNGYFVFSLVSFKRK